MNAIAHIDTSLLHVAYKVDGPSDGFPILLLHGWPDDATTFDAVAPFLHRVGYRTFSPWLRGFGQTRFRSNDTLRSGQIAAFAQDTLDIADALGLGQFALVGHDWGARIAYLLTSIVPERITKSIALSVAWEPGEPATPPLPQAKAFWYQWFMATERGAEFIRKHGKAFARFQWQSWSPSGWWDEAVFNTVAESFANPDWAEVTLHSYRVRWNEAEPDPRYAQLEARQKAARTISVPTLMLQGGADRCLLAATSEGKEQYFSGFYVRRVLDGIGHFPTREAPRAVGELAAEFLRQETHTS